MIPVTAYGAIFAANECELNFNSTQGILEVVGIPKRSKKVIEAALADISKFENTANYADGMAAIHLAEYIDGAKTTLPDAVRIQLLNALGITRDGKYISQVLASQKTNRSWHISEEPNKCTYFGELCTHRGIQNIPGKRGRKSTRTPEQYHQRNSVGAISREQLVTPALEALVANIASDKLISVSKETDILALNFDKMSSDEIDAILAKIKDIKENIRKDEKVGV